MYNSMMNKYLTINKTCNGDPDPGAIVKTEIKIMQQPHARENGNEKNGSSIL